MRLLLLSATKISVPEAAISTGPFRETDDGCPPWFAIEFENVLWPITALAAGENWNTSACHKETGGYTRIRLLELSVTTILPPAAVSAGNITD